MSSQPEPVKFPLPQSVTWRIRVDAALCIGSGICVGTAPKLFAVDDRQRAQPVSELVEAGEVVRDVAAACPVEAISITDAETGAPVSLALEISIPITTPTTGQ